MQVRVKKGEESFSLDFSQATAWRQLGYEIVIDLPYVLDDDDYAQLSAGSTIAIESVTITPPSNVAVLSEGSDGVSEVITDADQAIAITKQVLSATITNPVVLGKPRSQTISTDAQGRIISVINEY